MPERWSASVEGSVGLRTLNTQRESVAKAAPTVSLTEVPPVLQRDGIWVPIQPSQEGITPSARKRQRKKRQGKKRGIQVALGLWSDGKRETSCCNSSGNTGVAQKKAGRSFRWA